MKEINGDKMKLLSFGEVLYDIYPDSKHIGGAPMNFAAHFVKNGSNAYLASAVGNDDLGKDVIAQLKNWNIKTNYISVLDDKQTGKCIVELDDNLIPSYNLLTDVAYDYIKSPVLHDNSFDVLYFGTLVLRSEHNLISLRRLIDNYKFREIFVDINIRPPFYSKDSILFAVQNATILKISDEELPVVSDNIDGIIYNDYDTAAYNLCEKFKNIKLILITLGDKGAFAYDCIRKKSYQCKAKKVNAVSTVGAGDSFAAAFLAQYSAGRDISYCLEYAAKISAYVVSKKEAVPDYDSNFMD